MHGSVVSTVGDDHCGASEARARAYALTKASADSAADTAPQTRARVACIVAASLRSLGGASLSSKREICAKAKASALRLGKLTNLSRKCLGTPRLVVASAETLHQRRSKALRLG